jgi:tetratricopeptide (TPR) repeat protein
VAKKKKLNKRAVAILIAIGAAVLLAGATWSAKWWLPRDPAAFAAKGDAAFEANNFEEAEQHYKNACNYGKDPVYLYKLAKTQWEICRASPLSEQQKDEKIGQVIQNLRSARVLRPTYLEPQQMLCDVYWGRSPREFVHEANLLIGIDANQPLALYRRGVIRARESLRATEVDAALGDLAVEDIRRAMELQPDEPSYRRELVGYLLHIHWEPRAEKVFEDETRRDPNSVEIRIEYADFLQGAKRHGDALEQIEQAIRRDANDIQGYLARANFYQRLGDANFFAEARVSLEAAKAIDEADFRVYQQMARVFLRDNQVAPALQCMRDGIQRVADRLAKDPPAAQVARLRDSAWQINSDLAVLLLEVSQKQVPDALDQAEKALAEMDRLAPDHVGRARVAGLLAFHRGNLPQAYRFLSQAAREGSIDESAIDALIDVQMRAGMPGEARETLDAYSRGALGQRRAGLIVLKRAEIKMMEHDFGGAATDVNQVLRTAPANPQALRLRAILDVLNGSASRLPEDITLTQIQTGLLVDRVSQLISEKKNAEAISLLEDLHKADADNRQVTGMLVDAYLAAGREGSVDDLRKSLQTSNPAMASWVADEVNLHKQPDPNQRYAMRVERLDANSLTPIQKTLAMFRIAAQEGLTEIANKHMDEAIQLDPNNPVVIARAFARAIKENAQRKDWSQAQAWAQRAVAINADSVNGLGYEFELIDARLLASEPNQRAQLLSEGIDKLSRILERQPRSKPIRARLGDYYFFTNDFARAKAQYEQVLQVDSTFFPAVKGMAIVTAGKPGEHDGWVEQASRLPQGRGDPYIQGEAMAILERGGDANSVLRRIEARQKVLEREPENLDNIYRLGVLCEQAWRIAENANNAERSREMSARAERMFTLYLEKSPSKLVGARPLAEFYGRGDRLDALASLMNRLADEKDVTALRILSGDSLNYMDANRAEAAYKQAIEQGPQDPRPREALGRFYRQRGRWLEAARAYKECLALEPADRTALLWSAFALIQGNELAEAEKVVADLLARDAASPDAQGLLGMLAMKQKRYDVAEKAFDAALQGGNTNIRALLGRSRLYVIHGQIDKARGDLMIVRSVTRDPGVSMEYAQICLALGDVQSAESVYREVIAQQKDHVGAIAALSELYLDQENWTRLDTLLNDAMKRFPKEPAFRMMDAQRWKARKQMPQWLEALRQAVEIAPASSAARSAYMVALLDNQQWDKALAVAEESESKPSMAARSLAVKGRALARMGRSAQAPAVFQAALTASKSVGEISYVAQQASMAYETPRAACEAAGRWPAEANVPSAALKVFLGCLHVEARDYAVAASRFEEALAAVSAPSERATVGVYLGQAYYQAKDFPKAEKAFLDVLRVSPEEMQALNNLAYLYANDLNDAAKALPYAQKALEIAVGNANVVDTYGWVMVQLKRYPEAVEALRRGVMISPAQAILRYHLGYALEQAGSFDEALRQYDEGLRLPHDGAESQAVYNDLQAGADRLRKRLKPE